VPLLDYRRRLGAAPLFHVPPTRWSTRPADPRGGAAGPRDRERGKWTARYRL